MDVTFSYISAVECLETVHPHWRVAGVAGPFAVLQTQPYSFVVSTERRMVNILARRLNSNNQIVGEINTDTAIVLDEVRDGDAVWRVQAAAAGSRVYELVVTLYLPDLSVALRNEVDASIGLWELSRKPLPDSGYLSALGQEEEVDTEPDTSIQTVSTPVMTRRRRRARPKMARTPPMNIPPVRFIPRLPQMDPVQ